MVIVVAAALLQASRLPFRWNQVSIAYASYFKEYGDAVRADGWDAALTTFVGLHPPAYSILFCGMVGIGVPALVWHGVSGLFSVAAVPVTYGAARRTWGGRAAMGAALAAAAVLAISPHRNAYGLEPNNYPLLILATALQLLAFSTWWGRLDRDPGRKPTVRDVAYAATTAFAMYTHVLAIALPASQLVALALHPEGRRRSVRFAAVQGAAALPCLVLLPAILQGGGAPPMNDPAGALTAVKVALIDFPTRYGARLGVAGVGLGFAVGAWRIVTDRERLGVPALSWLVHCAGTMALIAWLVASGTAAAHQFPYYLALLPSGALVVGAAFRPSPNSGIGRTLVIVAVVIGLGVHAGSQALAYAAAQQQWSSARVDRALMDVAVREWTPGSSLLLIGFPQFRDDDKDVVDPTWALIPLTEPIRFAHPGVPTLVTADPYFGQPVLMGDRWLYTFTEFQPERIDPVAQYVLGQRQRVVLAIYNTEFAAEELSKAERWASGYPGLGRRAQGQALWVIDPFEILGEDP